MIYYKQEKFNFAEIHFKKALSINPQSSVLLCHIGVVRQSTQSCPPTVCQAEARLRLYVCLCLCVCRCSMP